MSVQAFSPNQPSKTAANFVNQPFNWNGRSVVVTDRAYQDKQAVEAGVGPGMFDGLGRGLITIAILFAAAVAGLAVGIATGSLQSALITSSIIGATAAVSNLFLYMKDRHF